MKLRNAALTEEIKKMKGYFTLSTSSEKQENKSKNYNQDFNWQNADTGVYERETSEMEIDQNPYWLQDE